MATNDPNKNFDELLASSDPKRGSGDSANSKPVEEWAGELKTPDWLFAAAKAYAKWPHGREATKSEFEKAIEAVDGVVCR